MSWKPEVIADSSDKWCGNALRFATRDEAEANVQDLMMRWCRPRHPCRRKWWPRELSICRRTAWKPRAGNRRWQI